MPNDISLPESFPSEEFRAFGVAAKKWFHPILSDEDLADEAQRRLHFDWSWQAVRYRYRSCAESNEEFKQLFANPSDMWTAGWGDEELNYKFERCIYQFFTAAVSIFDSFAFCLYYLGNGLRPDVFPKVEKPRGIRWTETMKGWKTAFPDGKLTDLLVAMPQDPRYATVDLVRNIVGHRVSGRRNVRASSTIHADGTTTEWREETWYLPGTTEKMVFDEDMLQRWLDGIALVLSSLISAAREFIDTWQEPERTV